MKILAIAYACEPCRGSEPGVGWNWIRQAAMLEDVSISVVTRANNKSVIEGYNFENPDVNDDKLDFYYYDLPKTILRHKHGDKNIKFFYALWQIGVLAYIKKHIQLDEYDIIWDFNFGSLALPDFIYRLKKKYIIGPVSTKESIPKTYRKTYSLKQRVKYDIQQFVRVHLWLNPFTWKALKKAELIITCNEMSKKYLPRNKKSIAVFHNGLDLKESPNVAASVDNDFLELVFAGRLIDSKNLETALLALKFLKEKHNNFRFDIYGKGPLKNTLQELASEYNLLDNVIFHSNVKQNELFDIYRTKDVFFFPSLLEISSTAVMEAMYCGLVPVCLDIPCMEYILDNEGIVSVPNISPIEDAKQLSSILLNMIENKDTVCDMKKNAMITANNMFLWKNKSKEIHRVITIMKLLCK